MIEQDLQEVRRLPTLASEEQLVAAIRLLISGSNGDGAATPQLVDIAETLVDLVDRQSAWYAPFRDANVYREIEEWVVRTWNPSILALFDAHASLIINSCFSRSSRGMELLQEALSAPDSRVREIAADTLAEAETNGQLLDAPDVKPMLP
jgi:hypothetical protein